MTLRNVVCLQVNVFFPFVPVISGTVQLHFNYFYSDFSDILEYVLAVLAL